MIIIFILLDILFFLIMLLIGIIKYYKEKNCIEEKIEIKKIQ